MAPTVGSNELRERNPQDYWLLLKLMQHRKANLSVERNADLLGITCAVLCLMHCWSLPILLMLAPTIQLLEFLAGPLAHQLMFVAALLAALYAMMPELRRHRDPWVATFLVLGLTCLFVEAFLLQDLCCRPIDAKLLSAPTPMQQASFLYEPVIMMGLSDHLQIANAFELLPSIQPWLSPLGGCCLIVAHLANLRFRIRRHERKCCDASRKSPRG